MLALYAQWLFASGDADIDRTTAGNPQSNPRPSALRVQYTLTSSSRWSTPRTMESVAHLSEAMATRVTSITDLAALARRFRHKPQRGDATECVSPCILQPYAPTALRKRAEREASRLSAPSRHHAARRAASSSPREGASEEPHRDAGPSRPGGATATAPMRPFHA